MAEIIVWATLALVDAACIYHIIVVRQWHRLGKKLERDIDEPEQEGDGE